MYTFRTEPDHIDGLRVLHERTKVNDLAFLPRRFDFP